MSIEVMRQALEALEDPWKTGPDGVANAITALRAAIEQAEKQGQHWCTYCRGHNAHNCQFNTTIPRVHTYVTNTTAPAPRQWVELTDDEARALVNRATFGDRTNWQALVYMIDAKLKEKNAA